MKVTEIFESIQGEGIYTGADTTFVRFAGCSTGCARCDTMYAWDPDSGEDYDPDRLFLTLGGMRPTKICLTGGEPLEQDPIQLAKLVSSLGRHDFDIHVETCGLVYPTDDILAHVDFWTISPKLSSMEPLTTIQPLQLQTLYYDIWDKGSSCGQMKFVVDTEDDVVQAKRLMVEALSDEYDWPLVLQPLNRDPRPTIAPSLIDYVDYFNQMKKLKTWAEIYFDEYDWRVLPQLHYLMWAGAKGI